MTDELRGELDQPDDEQSADSTDTETGPSDAVTTDRLFELFRGRDREEEAAYAQVATENDYSDQLLVAAKSYGQRHQFEVGQLVQWKPTMRNRPRPLESVPAVVVAVKDTPSELRFAEGRQSPEPTDMVIGVLDGERIFELTAVPSARFMPWEP